MKYNINLNQAALAKTNLDLIDGAILDYLKDICSSPNKKIEKCRVDGYTWINLNKLIKDNPLIGRSIKTKQGISKRIQNIANEKFIDTRIINQKLFIILLEKIDELWSSKDSEPSTTVDGLGATEEKPSIWVDGVSTTVDGKPSTTVDIDNNTNTDYKNNDNCDAEHTQIVEIFDIFRAINPTIQYGHITNRKAIAYLIKHLGFERLRAVAKYAISVQGGRYAPVITTPYQLNEKLSQLKIYAERIKASAIAEI